MAQGRDEERSNAKAAKEAIIAEAEEIKDSTAWVETSRKFNELMDRWKKAGRAGRRDDDALWARFRAAADTFFNARQADREQISSSEKENLAKKEELLTKAEALVPVKDEKAAKQLARHWPPFRRNGTRSVTFRAMTCTASKAVLMLSTSRSSC